MDETVRVIAYTLYGEARGTSLLDRLCVLAVIRERAMRPGWWGNGWEEVCKAKFQFSCWLGEHDEAHRRNYQAMMAAPDADPTIWREMLLLAEYAIHGMKDRDVCELFGIDHPDAMPTHYFSTPLTAPPKAWGADIVRRRVPWASGFRWYTVVQGRPARREN